MSDPPRTVDLPEALTREHARWRKEHDSLASLDDILRANNQRHRERIEEELRKAKTEEEMDSFDEICTELNIERKDANDREKRRHDEERHKQLLGHFVEYLKIPSRPFVQEAIIQAFPNMEMVLKPDTLPRPSAIGVPSPPDDGFNQEPLDNLSDTTKIAQSEVPQLPVDDHMERSFDHGEAEIDTAATSAQDHVEPSNPVVSDLPCKRKAACTDTNAAQKRVRLRPSDEPYTTKTIDFKAIYQNGEASVKRRIICFPIGSKNYYILRCGGCHKEFQAKERPVSGATKHLNRTPHHKNSSGPEETVERLGILVLNCNYELAALNNSGLENPESDDEQEFSEQTFSEHEVKTNKETRRRKINRGVAGISEPVAGEVYSAFWRSESGLDSGFYPGVLLPLGDFAPIGLTGALSQTELIDNVPDCYVFDAQTGEFGGWKDGYEVGGPRESERKHPVIYLDGKDFPDDADVSWVASNDLEDYTKRRWESRFRRAVKEYQKMRHRFGVGEEADEQRDLHESLIVTMPLLDTSGLTSNQAGEADPFGSCHRSESDSYRGGSSNGDAQSVNEDMRNDDTTPRPMVTAYHESVPMVGSFTGATATSSSAHGNSQQATGHLPHPDAPFDSCQPDAGEYVSQAAELLEEANRNAALNTRAFTPQTRPSPPESGHASRSWPAASLTPGMPPPPSVHSPASISTSSSGREKEHGPPRARFTSVNRRQTMPMVNSTPQSVSRTSTPGSIPADEDLRTYRMSSHYRYLDGNLGGIEGFP